MTLTIKGATTIKSLTTVGFYPGSLFAAGEQGVWYDPSDMTTMFQDAAGTTPVTAVEQSVGLLLDKRSPAYSVYFDGTGDYLSAAAGSRFEFGAGNYTIEGWFYVTTLSSNNGIYYYGAANNNRLQLGISTGGSVQFYCELPASAYDLVETATNIININTWYHIAFVRISSVIKIYVNGVERASQGAAIGSPTGHTPNIGYYVTSDTNRFFNGYISNFRVIKDTALYTSNFTPTRAPLTPVSNTSLLTCGTSWSGNPTITVNGDAKANSLNPFGAATGNHAIQSSAGNRPVLSARVNLLTQTGTMWQSPWLTSSGGGAAVVTQASDPYVPDGSGYSALVTVGLAGGYYFVQSVNVLPSTQYIFSFYARKGTATDVRLSVYDNTNLGEIVPTTTNYAGSISTDKFTRITTTFTTPAGCTNIGVYPTRDGLSTGTVFFWGADLRPTNQGVNLPTYQRVNTSSDYDTTNFPMYLKFDGTNDSLATANVNFTSTDKVTAFSSVRKFNSGGSFGVIFEVSTYLPDNVGTFNMAAPGGLAGSTENYSSTVRGSSAFVGYDAVTFTSPITNVLSTSYDLSANTISQQVRPRVNGVIPTLNASGSSNAGMTIFGTYPIYIGARAGSSLYFNGNIYGLIIRGASSSNTQIQATESWLNQKTKAY